MAKLLRLPSPQECGPTLARKAVIIIETEIAQYSKQARNKDVKLRDFGKMQNYLLCKDCRIVGRENLIIIFTER